MNVDFSRIEDKYALDLFHQAIGSQYRKPDLVITGEDGEPYLYRWWLLQRNSLANVYAHYQVASDPARPLHDHPWDNTSVVLAGGYTEAMNVTPRHGMDFTNLYHRKPGDVIARKAHWAHRLILPKDIPGTLTFFTTGPRIHSWGFWYKGQHVKHEEWTTFTKDGKSIWHGPTEELDANYTV